MSTVLQNAQNEYDALRIFHRSLIPTDETRDFVTPSFCDGFIQLRDQTIETYTKVMSGLTQHIEFLQKLRQPADQILIPAFREGLEKLKTIVTDLRGLRTYCEPSLEELEETIQKTERAKTQEFIRLFGIDQPRLESEAERERRSRERKEASLSLFDRNYNEMKSKISITPSIDLEKLIKLT